MKNFWNISVLFIFINFLAMPTVVEFFGVDMPQTGFVSSEEESHGNGISLISEKDIPKTVRIQDFIHLAEYSVLKKTFFLKDDLAHYANYRSIFSPPPEF